MGTFFPLPKTIPLDQACATIEGYAQLVAPSTSSPPIFYESGLRARLSGLAGWLDRLVSSWAKPSRVSLVTASLRLGTELGLLRKLLAASERPTSAELTQALAYCGQLYRYSTMLYRYLMRTRSGRASWDYEKQVHGPLEFHATTAQYTLSQRVEQVGHEVEAFQRRLNQLVFHNYPLPVSTLAAMLASFYVELDTLVVQLGSTPPQVRLRSIRSLTLRQAREVDITQFDTRSQEAILLDVLQRNPIPASHEPVRNN